jgi:hypothetical protein
MLVAGWTDSSPVASSMKCETFSFVTGAVAGMEVASRVGSAVVMLAM